MTLGGIVTGTNSAGGCPDCPVPDGCFVETDPGTGLPLGVNVPWPAAAPAVVAELIDITDGMAQFRYTEAVTGALQTIVQSLDTIQAVPEGYVTVVDTNGNTFTFHTQAVQYRIDSQDAMTIWFDSNEAFAPWAEGCNPGIEASMDFILGLWLSSIGSGPQPAGNQTLTLFEVQPTLADAPQVCAHVTNWPRLMDQQLPISDCVRFTDCAVNCVGPATTENLVQASACSGGIDLSITANPGGGYDYLITSDDLTFVNEFVTRFNAGSLNGGVCYESATIFATTAGYPTSVINFPLFGPGLIGQTATVVPAGLCQYISFTYDPAATRDWLLQNGCGINDPAVQAQDQMDIYSQFIDLSGNFDLYDTAALVDDQSAQELVFSQTTEDREALVVDICNHRQLAGSIADLTNRFARVYRARAMEFTGPGPWTPTASAGSFVRSFELINEAGNTTDLVVSLPSLDNFRIPPGERMEWEAPNSAGENFIDMNGISFNQITAGERVWLRWEES